MILLKIFSLHDGVSYQLKLRGKRWLFLLHFSTFFLKHNWVVNLHCFLQKCQTTQELIKFRSHLFIVIEQIHRKRHVWNFRRIHLWSGRNYKYVEQNAHIGQLAKVTDVELLHYIMPALSPSLKVIALEPSFFILQTLPIIPNLFFTSTISIPADYHSSGTIEFCNFDPFQHQH